MPSLTDTGIESLTVVTHLRAQPGKEQQLRDALTALIEPTRRERGCLGYDLHQGVEDTSVFVFHENWQTPEDLDMHLQTPHVQQAVTRMGELLSGEPTVTRLRLVA